MLLSVQNGDYMHLTTNYEAIC